MFVRPTSVPPIDRSQTGRSPLPPRGVVAVCVVTIAKLGAGRQQRSAPLFGAAA